MRAGRGGLANAFGLIAIGEEHAQVRLAPSNYPWSQRCYCCNQAFALITPKERSH